MIYLFESYLDSSVSSDDDNLYIKDYKLVTADRLENLKRGDVCVYLMESLPVRCLLNPYLKESLTFEVTINSKRGCLVSMYRSPSQNSDDFNSFTTNLEKLVLNISSTNFIIMIGDFNAKSRNWPYNDTTTAEGTQLHYLTSLYGLKQVITEPTLILENSSSCIDLLSFQISPTLSRILECIQHCIQNVTIK